MYVWLEFSFIWINDCNPENLIKKRENFSVRGEYKKNPNQEMTS